ncbi:phosphatase PAP2 family protein [Cohnella zeiphila]|uniref:Phosphatase PAP2 family protein n=1 Tax=Cohnella zeiphila TaxID=2761120 RepID=A0A7X0SM59_9BACL|nr:phosphatase PAP2 family protein [Cohnella zeiphila]MBB6730293.1 phosphatase PAP2 family protein [Cohnella zeiphila]
MNKSTGPRRAWLISFICLLAFGAFALLIDTHRIYSFDLRQIRFWQGMESPGMTRLAEALSASGRTKPVVGAALLVMAFLFFALRRRWELLMVVMALGGSTLLNTAVKNAVGRERPSLHRIAEEAGYSFPSGHAMAALSLYGITVYLLWRHVRNGWGKALIAAVAAVYILAIGASRIYLGVHYPSDVIGGYLLSGCWLAATIGTFRSLQARRTRSISSAA